jgi:integrase
MAFPKAAPRVKGPYSERGGTRFRIRICDATGHRDVYFPTLQQARDGMRQAERELLQYQEGRTLCEVLDAYCKEKVRRGLCQQQSADAHRDRLANWLTDYLDQDVGKLTPKRAVALYDELVVRPTSKTGRSPAAATHRFYLKLAQTLFRWAVRKGYVRESPFAEVHPVGRPNRGKKQLRFEEAERFITAGFRLFEERNDWLALAAVTSLLLGLRASEALHLHVRDLDCGGSKLWIAAIDSYHGKTENARRDTEVPGALQSRLVKLASGRAPDEYLFGIGRAGKNRSRQSLYAAVHRICKVAHVPWVCTRSLRGLWATAGVSSGAVSHAVAATLGHGSFEVTAKHYVQPGTIEGSRTSRLVGLLSLEGTQPATDSPSIGNLTAEQLLAKLPTETLTKLLELAVPRIDGRL